jgi:hypothetical protein
MEGKLQNLGHVKTVFYEGQGGVCKSGMGHQTQDRDQE